ncbi:MAG: tyrosine--tRNA ligase [Dehalococcoidia bacterium]|nr:tyrosine--tRNA ligase [Dehalococcoidia bacterium]
MPLDQATVHRITKRAVAEIVSEAEFVRLLQEGKPLRLKMGFDPSRPDLTLGHVVGLRKLRQLQELGHQLILIVGDWTAQIGDPSGQSATRPMLTAEEVRQNAQTYLRQFFHIVDKERTQVVWQSEWFGKFTLADVIRLTSRFTVAQFLQREDFRKRFEANRPIAITELLYPLLQAYDSVAIRADVEFGGTDQKFNLLVGRELQAMMGQRQQQCFLVPLLVGTDGAVKMSKSLGNYIAMEEPPEDQYGKVMSLPDSAILTYFELVTDVPDEEIVEMARALEHGTINPMTLKKQLAVEVVALLNSQEAAREAQAHFERVIQQKVLPEDVPTYKLPPGEVPRLSRLLVDAGLAPSISEARRLITQRAVEVDGTPVTSDEAPRSFAGGEVIRVGKRRFVRVVR